MEIEELIRRAIERQVAGARASDEAWASIARRLERKTRGAQVNRVLVAATTLLVAGGALVGLWAAFRSVGRPGAAAGGASPPSPARSSPPRTACLTSEATGDLDGDGLADLATLLVPAPVGANCSAVGTAPSFELDVSFGSGTYISQPFPDCESAACHLVGASDLDGDGISELVVNVGPGAAVSYDQIYRVSGAGVRPIGLAAPGDPAGRLEPGSAIRLGGDHSAVFESGFECEIQEDGSRTLIAWQAERDDAVSPWRVHFTTLELQGDVFVVVDTHDRAAVTDLHAPEGLCP